MIKLILKPGREKSLKRRHPWVFSGAVGKLTGNPQPGDTIAVHSSDGEFLAMAACNPQSHSPGLTRRPMQSGVCSA